MTVGKVGIPFVIFISCPQSAWVIREVISGELLTKQAIKKHLLYTKNTYIFKRFLNLVTAGNEALRFCMPVSKKSAACELSHVFTPSINSSLLLKRCDRNQFFR
jgi:hypothetical protein